MNQGRFPRRHRPQHSGLDADLCTATLAGPVTRSFSLCGVRNMSMKLILVDSPIVSTTSSPFSYRPIDSSNHDGFTYSECFSVMEMRRESESRCHTMCTIFGFCTK